jgi:quaternary ammonium compound-resistance protein SugE
MTLAWAYLIVAGLFEIGWPIGLKWAQAPGKLIIGVVVAVVSMALSGVLLFLAQREIELGTSYAVWTGIGAAGTFLVGIWFFGDPTSLGRWLGPHHRRGRHAQARALALGAREGAVYARSPMRQQDKAVTP